MLKFTSVSGSAQDITAITLTVTIIRTGITIDLIIDRITGRIIGAAGTAITGITIPITTGANLIRNSHTGWLEVEPARFILAGGLLGRVGRTKQRGLFSRLRGSSRFGRAFAWLIKLELFSQLLNECGYFFLPLRLDLLPQRLFDFSTFLNVPGFKPGALLWIQLKT
jgi:hypothetical protein